MSGYTMITIEDVGLADIAVIPIGDEPVEVTLDEEPTSVEIEAIGRPGTPGPKGEKGERGEPGSLPDGQIIDGGFF